MHLYAHARMRAPSGVAFDSGPVKKKLAVITYDATPEGYRHWTLSIAPPVATLTLVAGEGTGHDSGGSDEFEALLSSLLRVDIELSDVVRRLRFEYPDVSAVVVTGRGNNAFTTGIAEIPPEAAADVTAAVRTFRDEVRCAIEDASASSGQYWLAALNGPASGPGYELALATDEIVLVEDGRSAISLPAIIRCRDLTSTGGLTRLVDKRHVRPDLIDAFCSSPEGIRAPQAVDWGLVDLSVPERCFADVVAERALTSAGNARRGPASEAVELGPLWLEEFDGGFAYPNLRVELDRDAGEAALTVVGPSDHECFAPEPGPKRLRSRWWPLAVCRELDDALLRLRSYRPRVESLVLRTEGDPLAVASADVALTSGYEHDWFVREVVLYWQRTLKRLDLAWPSVIALVEPGSCFVGTLLEMAFAADRVYMVDGEDLGDSESALDGVFLTGMNFGPLPQANGVTRLQSRFRSREDHVAALAQRVGDAISAKEAAELGLVTAAIGQSEWEAMTRRAIAERAHLSFDSRVGLTVALHTAGPATLETKILGRHGRGASGTSR